jgi:hypothetical protein
VKAASDANGSASTITTMQSGPVSGPWGSLARGDLFTSAWTSIQARDHAADPSCDKYKLITTGVDQPIASASYRNSKLVGGHWKEGWVIDHCGARAAYEVEFEGFEKKEPRISITSVPPMRMPVGSVEGKQS